MCIQEKITDEFRSQVQKAQNSLFEIQSKVKSENTDFLEGVNFKVSAEDLKNFEGFLYDQLEESEDNNRIGGVLDSPYLVGVLSWTQNFLKYFFKEVYEIICIMESLREYGPIWIAGYYLDHKPKVAHAVVVTGIQGNSIHYNDPWEPEAKVKSVEWLNAGMLDGFPDVLLVKDKSRY